MHAAVDGKVVIVVGKNSIMKDPRKDLLLEVCSPGYFTSTALEYRFPLQSTVFKYVLSSILSLKYPGAHPGVNTAKVGSGTGGG
jgi:hypothetical protein